LKYKPFEESKRFVRKLGLKNQNQWREYSKSTDKPLDIPADPSAVYKKDWKGMGDWLGTGFIAPQNRIYKSFDEAKKFVHSLELKSYDEWREYCKSGKKPPDIPANPLSVYKNEWKGFGDWLGTGTIASYNIKYRSYEDAKKFIHSLGLKNLAEWRKYCKSSEKPPDIPGYPEHVYRKDWKGWGDWLGLDVIIYRGTRYTRFDDARKIVHKLGIVNQDEWWAYCNSRKPGNIPSYPNIVYKEHWKGWGDWLGTGTIVDNDKIYRPFADAKDFVQSFKLKDVNEWTKYWKSGKKPRDIPSYPKMTYREQWSGWRDWLGINYISYEKKEHRSFEEARRFVHGLGIKTREDWKYYSKSGKKPLDIPANPNRTYEKDWKGWGDWLGTGTVSSHDREFRPFQEARQFSHKLGLKSSGEWKSYCKSGKKPADIPSNPNLSYEKDWKGMGDWLGTGFIAPQNRIYKSFDEAKKFVHSLGLKSLAEWGKYSKSGKKPSDIPTSPSRPYKEHWKGMGDWLGTGTLSPKDRRYREFEEARIFARSLGLKSKEDWLNYCKSGKKPLDISQKPYRTYKGDWIWWGDWLGYENPEWVVRRVKELLQDLIKSEIIYQWNEAVLYSFLLRKGVLNLEASNRHAQFFKNLIEASRTHEGRKAIEEYANSYSETPPELSKLTPLSKESSQEQEEEIESASPQELAHLAENIDPLDYGEIKTAEQVLAQTNVLESINVDKEAMQFYVDYSIDELWKSAFRDAENTILAVKHEGKNGNKYHDTVVETFLSDYEGTQNIKVPEGYAFPSDPTLMQLHVAFKTKNLDYFGNFSGTGAGKTLSAVLASRVIDSKMTVIVCPNDVVEQWAKCIIEIFPDSKVIKERRRFMQSMMKININI
jgi:hypothetical protein